MLFAILILVIAAVSLETVAFESRSWCPPSGIVNVSTEKKNKRTYLI